VAWTKATSNPIRVVRHDSPGQRFELAFATPGAELRPYVREFVGWIDESTTHVRRRQIPSRVLPLIINFDAVVREQKADATEASTYRSFTAGLHERYTVVETLGRGLGLQVNFTPLGARLYYDTPLVEFTNRTVELPDVIGAAAGALTSQLHDAASWSLRIQILEQHIRSRVRRARSIHDSVVHALDALTIAHGNVRVRGVADASAWGGRHFTRRFREDVGLAPKAFARLLRLNRAIRLGTTGRAGSLASIAQACGYYDQAHLARECRAIAGLAPSALIQCQLPAGSGFRA
jgi:AraC-like DNA-binding protein